MTHAPGIGQRTCGQCSSELYGRCQCARYRLLNLGYFLPRGWPVVSKDEDAKHCPAFKQKQDGSS